MLCGETPTAASDAGSDPWFTSYDGYFRSTAPTGTLVDVARAQGMIDPARKLHAMSVYGQYPNQDIWLGDAVQAAAAGQEPEHAMNDRSAPAGIDSVNAADAAALESAKTIATVVYALQAAAFVIGLTAIAAIIVNYVKLGEVRGTWLESHFRWQIRTFWFALMWGVAGLLTLVLLIGWPILLANAVWVIYRVVKGWVRLADGRPMYAEN